MRGQVFIDTHIAGQVVEIDASGRISLMDRTGVSGTMGKHYFVFPATQFDLDAALADLHARDQLFLEEGHFGPLYGNYEAPRDLAHVLRPYLHPLPSVLPSNEAISRIIGHTVDIEQFLAAPMPKAA